ncbi:MAG: hypothetical protein FWC70_10720 [Defluviitaleaceae bacterium]|nr:hypothetical protein [Defluviitaleaceae bacterium]
MLKNETQYQMYLDVVDICQKNSFAVESEKDGVSTKRSVVYHGGRACGKITVVATPPKNRDSSMYSMSAHAKLVAAKEEAQAMEDYLEGEWQGSDGSLLYYGHSPENSWVTLVDKNFQKWREKSPLYLSNIDESEALKKKKPASVEEFASLEKEFKRLAESFESITFYRNAESLAVECAGVIPKMKGELLQKANAQFEKLGAKSGSTSKHYREIRDEYAALSKKVAILIPFEGAEERLTECEEMFEKSEQSRVKAVYAESVEQLTSLQMLKHTESPDELKKLISDYETLLGQFMSIEQYGDSGEKVLACRDEIAKYQTSRNAVLYKNAKNDYEDLEGRPMVEKFFEYVYRMRQYGKLAKRFKETSPHDESDRLAHKCAKESKAFRWKVFGRIAPWVAGLIALTALGLWIYFTFFTG